MKKKQITITERDRRVVEWVANLSDAELFGLECFLAGARVAALENQTGTQDPPQIETSNRNTE